MDLMQTILDFKQNLESNPATKAGAAAAASPDRSPGSAQRSAAASTSSTDGSTTITANDFLQLLVAEMKNQDPTADQDPNAYIDQLVQVNSLQQLIAINQDLTPAATATGSSTGGVARASFVQATLGSADGTPSAALARSMTPPAAQPRKAPVAGTTSLNPVAGDVGAPFNPGSASASARGGAGKVSNRELSSAAAAADNAGLRW